MYPGVLFGWLVLIVSTWSNICWSDVSCYMFVSRLYCLDIADGIMLHVEQANNPLLYSLCGSLLDLKVWINIKKPALKLEHFDILQFFFSKAIIIILWTPRDRILTWDSLISADPLWEKHNNYSKNNFDPVCPWKSQLTGFSKYLLLKLNIFTYVHIYRIQI